MSVRVLRVVPYLFEDWQRRALQEAFGEDVEIVGNGQEALSEWSLAALIAKYHPDYVEARQHWPLPLLALCCWALDVRVIAWIEFPAGFEKPGYREMTLKVTYKHFIHGQETTTIFSQR